MEPTTNEAKSDGAKSGPMFFKLTRRSKTIVPGSRPVSPSADKAPKQFKYKAKILKKFPPSGPLPAHFFRGSSDSGTATSNRARVTKSSRAKIDNKSSCTSLTLDRHEWDFSQLDAIELTTCRDYEMGRQAIVLEKLYQQRPEAERFPDSQWLENRVNAMRRAWQITGFTSSVRENPNWFRFPASRVLMLYPEWPKIAYLEIDRRERLRRIKEFSVAMTEEDRLANLADAVAPDNPWTGEKSITTIAFPKSLSREERRAALDALLETEFPSRRRHGNNKHRGTPYSKPQGRGSDKAKVADDLNAIAVHRLHEAGFSRREIIQRVKHPAAGKSPGDQVYSTEKQLDKPLKRIWRRAVEFRQQTIGDLQPLEPLNLSQPDFSLL